MRNIYVNKLTKNNNKIFQKVQNLLKSHFGAQLICEMLNSLKVIKIIKNNTFINKKFSFKMIFFIVFLRTADKLKVTVSNKY